MEISVKNKHDSLFFTRLFVPQASQSSPYRRIKFEIWSAIPPTKGIVCGMESSMANVISDETIEYVGILAKLELSEEEKEAAKKDMGRMLDYIDKLGELDTTGVEPMSHVFPVQNVFREDVVTNGDESEQTLANAPGEKDNMFVVPKTFD